MELSLEKSMGVGMEMGMATRTSIQVEEAGGGCLTLESLVLGQEKGTKLSGTGIECSKERMRGSKGQLCGRSIPCSLWMMSGRVQDETAV